MDEDKFRVDRAIKNYQNGTITLDQFLSTCNGIRADMDHRKWQAEQDAMTPAQRNEYWRGYEKGEFGVGR